MATKNEKSTLRMLGARISEAVSRQKERRRRARAQRIAAYAIQGLGLEPLESRVLLSAIAPSSIAGDTMVIAGTQVMPSAFARLTFAASGNTCALEDFIHAPAGTVQTVNYSYTVTGASTATVEIIEGTDDITTEVTFSTDSTGTGYIIDPKHGNEDCVITLFAPPLRNLAPSSAAGSTVVLNIAGGSGTQYDTSGTDDLALNSGGTFNETRNGSTESSGTYAYTQAIGARPGIARVLANPTGGNPTALVYLVFTSTTGGSFYFTDQTSSNSLSDFDYGTFSLSFPPTQLVISKVPATVVAGQPVGPTLTVKVEDAHGNVVTDDDSNVNMSLFNSIGTLNGTVTVPAINGVATFDNLAIDASGTYTLAAADGTDTLSNFKSGSFKITPAGLASVDFIQEPPANAIAGKNISPSITVEAEDAFGNGISGQTIKLVLASSPTGAVSPGTLTAKTSSTGIAAFSNLILHTAGAYTLVASDGSISSVPSSSILLASAAPAKLVFTTQPANSTAGSPLAPVVVKIVDMYGNLEAGDDSVVTLSIATGPRPAAFTGSSTTAVNAVGGVATFNNLTLDTAGAYGLDGADSSDKLGKTASGKFEIAPAAVGSVAFVKQPPSSVVAGKTIAPSITVVVKDAFGNPLSGATVTLAVDTGPSGGMLIGVTQAVTSKAGVATFSGNSIHVSGIYTLAATSSEISSAASNNVVVAPAKALTMGFSAQPPADVGTGGTFSVAVAYLDTYGNIATSVNGTKVKLSLAVSPTGATLGGTAIVTVVNGVATFSGLSLNNAGTYQFKALGSLMDLGATSSSFMVGSLAFTATSPVAADNAVTLQALGLGTSSSNVQSIDFYWDPTGAGTTTGAVLLGTSNAEANWMLTATLPRTTDPVHPFPTSGSATFVAQAVDAGNALGPIQTVVSTVEAQPTIGTLTVPSLPINPSDQTGQSVFTAGSVSSASNVVTEVQFWLAPVGATVLAPDISKLLGVGVSVEGTADWGLTLPDSQLNFTFGTHIVWARAQDASGIWSEAVSADVLIVLIE